MNPRSILKFTFEQDRTIGTFVFPANLLRRSVHVLLLGTGLKITIFSPSAKCGLNYNKAHLITLSHMANELQQFSISLTGKVFSFLLGRCRYLLLNTRGCLSRVNFINWNLSITTMTNKITQKMIKHIRNIISNRLLSSAKVSQSFLPNFSSNSHRSPLNPTGQL